MPGAHDSLYSIAGFLAGLFLLEYGADKFVDHTAEVAKRLNVSPMLVGLLTCGAEWEELVVIMVSLSQENSSMALGNLMGSSIANILGSFSLGLLFIQSTAFDRSSKIYATVLMALTSVFIIFLYTLDAFMKRVAGVLLLVTFIVYIISVGSLIYQGTLTAPENDSDDDNDGDTNDEAGLDDDKPNDSGGDGTDEEKGRSTQLVSSFMAQGYSPGSLKAREGREPKAGKAGILRRPRNSPPRKSVGFHMARLLLGFVAIVISSYIIANSAAAIGREFGLPDTVVGTTILSIATTLPEKFVAVIGGVRKQPGIMVANTVGSNIFLLTICAGVVFLNGDASEIDLGFTVFEASVMWTASASLLCIVFGGGKRWMGSVLLCGYLGFLFIEVTNGRSIDEN